MSNQCVNKEISQRGSGVLQRTEIGMGECIGGGGGMAAASGHEGSGECRRKISRRTTEQKPECKKDVGRGPVMGGGFAGLLEQ